MRALAAAATAVAAPTPARLRLRLPLAPRAPRSGEPALRFLPPSLPESAAPTVAAVARPRFRRGETGGILGSVSAATRLWV